ncbi:MAG: hypothetical protein U5K27_08070 [Desulfotignum sp.]|nr:hypothetical protein [Desulfotignum sp.]
MKNVEQKWNWHVRVADENSLKSKFCGLCGQALSVFEPAPKTPAAAIDPIATLRRYLPMGMAEKILAQKYRIEGEIRQVTVLFCDLAGYTPKGLKYAASRDLGVIIREPLRGGLLGRKPPPAVSGLARSPGLASQCQDCGECEKKGR